MLARIQIRLSHHLHAARVSLRALYKTPFTTLMTVFVVAVALTLPALFWVMTQHMNQLTKDWQHGNHLSLYLKSPLSTNVENNVLSRVRHLAGVQQATLKSSAEGLAELQQQEGMQDIMHYLPTNPLPSMIDVIPSRDANAPEKLQQLYVQLKAYPEVEQAKLDMLWVNRLHAMVSFTSALTHGLTILLALTVVLIISNTLGLAMQHRQDEVMILKRLGAKDAYIMRPFLYMGVCYGLAGALLAVVLLSLFMLSLALAANALFAAYQMHYSLSGLALHQMGVLVVLAMSLGWLGAFASVSRQLAAIDP